MMFLLFAGTNYYPLGGIEDLIYIGDTIDSCKSEYAKHYRKSDYSGWAHIVDRNTMKMVCKAIFDKDDKFCGFNQDMCSGYISDALIEPPEKKEFDIKRKDHD